MTNGINGRALECITLVLRIGILFSKEPPEELLDMEEVIRELHRNKDAFTGLLDRNRVMAGPCEGLHIELLNSIRNVI